MKKRVVLSIGLATAILTGCGSSSNPTTTGTGYYIDAAVSGVDYVCGSQSGKTGSDGSFTFEKGKDCTFSLGSMKLREVKAATLKDQIKVIEDNLAVATLLQTLDSDGDPNNNGIVISAKIVEELKAKNITKLPTNQDEVAVIYEVIKNVDGYKGKLKSEDEAQTHLAKAQGSKLKELLAGKTFYNVSSKDYYLDELSFNETLTSLTWKTLYGDENDVGDNGTELFEVRGDKIFFIEDENKNIYVDKQTTDYLFIKSNTEIAGTRLYFDKAKAKAYFDTIESIDTIEAPGVEGPTPINEDSNPSDSDIAITQEMLDGKAFYYTSTDGNDTYYKKMSFSNGIWTKSRIKYETEDVKSSARSYTIQNGKILTKDGDNDGEPPRNMHIVLKKTTNDKWEMRFQATTDATNGTNVEFYINKPADYPAAL